MHPRDREIIRQYLKEGKSLNELAVGFGLSKSGIALVLERNQVKRRRKGARLKLTGEWLKA